MLKSADNATTRAKKLLSQYNDACKSLDPNFKYIKFDDIKSLEDCPFWDADITTEEIDFCALRQYMNKMRAIEELDLLEEEEIQFKLYALQRCQQLAAAINNETRGDGYKNLIARKLPAAEKLFTKVYNVSWQDYCNSQTQQQQKQQQLSPDEAHSYADNGNSGDDEGRDDKGEEEEEEEEEACPEDSLMVSFADLIMGMMGTENGEDVEVLQRELGIQEDIEADSMPTEE
ncbi:hypothetical protein BDC45DRAFT_529801 [Circinella umbellata]|nr:hypothetical protein BDC45DRAFT_529801 [Circinella umbellata]